MPESQKFELPPSGAHLGVCYRIVDLGTQVESYKGETKRQRKVILSWELPQEKMADDRPFSISKRYTFSAHEKSNFRLDLEAWRAKPFTQEELRTFDILKLLSKACVLTITHKEKEGGGDVYANIVSISPPMKGVAVPSSTVNDMFAFVMEPEIFNPKLLEKMGDKLKGIIQESPEWKALTTGEKPKPTQTSMELDDEIPF
jgi:hypothetical protein